jgi:hypothetical protein
LSPSPPGEWTKLGLDALDKGGNWLEYKSRLFDKVSIITIYITKTIRSSWNDKTFGHLTKYYFNAIFVHSVLKTIYLFFTFSFFGLSTLITSWNYCILCFGKWLISLLPKSSEKSSICTWANKTNKFISFHKYQINYCRLAQEERI